MTNSSAKTARITVADNGDGTLKVTNSLNDEPMVLVNTYKAGGETELTAMKIIENRAFQAGDRWTFTVNAADGVPMPERTEITIEPIEGTEAPLDFGKIMDLAERGLIGKLVEIESADGDTVEVVVE